MDQGIKINICLVFVDEKGKYGNPVGIVVDEKNKILKQERQKISTQLGFSETVFINDIDNGNISIFNPQHEIKFAGHAMVGTAWFINKLTNRTIDSLICQGEQTKTWKENDITWIRGRLNITPPWNHKQYNNPKEIENLSSSVFNSLEHTIVWAWIDEKKGEIRARTFAPDWGIPEDQANGSGSMQLAYKLKRELKIIHGKGSIIFAKPDGVDFAVVGGQVAEN